ncbi:MAG: lipoprotein [Oscillospiraceae bacterium]|nr:lipoprotein [Oscillospiraceae bacterium]
MRKIIVTAAAVIVLAGCTAQPQSQAAAEKEKAVETVISAIKAGEQAKLIYESHFWTVPDSAPPHEPHFFKLDRDIYLRGFDEFDHYTEEHIRYLQEVEYAALMQIHSIEDIHRYFHDRFTEKVAQAIIYRMFCEGYELYKEFDGELYQNQWVSVATGVFLSTRWDVENITVLSIDENEIQAQMPVEPFGGEPIPAVGITVVRNGDKWLLNETFFAESLFYYHLVQMGAAQPNEMMAREE